MPEAPMHENDGFKPRQNDIRMSWITFVIFSITQPFVKQILSYGFFGLRILATDSRQVADANLTHLKSVLCGASKGRYGRDKAIEIREAAKASIGSVMPAKSLELRHTIRLIHELDAEIDEIEAEIQQIMDELHSPITTIPGIGTRMKSKKFNLWHMSILLLTYAIIDV